MNTASIAHYSAETFMETADGFVVVSEWATPRRHYDYETHATLNDALDAYREYQDGEYERATAIGVFPVRNGMPIGSRIDPARLIALMQETRRP